MARPTPSPAEIALGPAWTPSAGVLARLRERRRERHIMRDLDSGKWQKVLLDMKLAQHRFRPMQRHDGTIDTLLIKLNVVAMSAKFHATVAAGEPAVITAAEENVEQGAALEQIKRRVLFDQLLQESVRVGNIERYAVLRIRTDDREGTIVELDDNDVAFPDGERRPDRQPSVWERRWVIERGQSRMRRPLRFLRIERHRVIDGRGVIEQEAFKTQSTDRLQDASKLERVPLAEAIGEAEAPADLTETGLDRPLLVQLAVDVEAGEPVAMLGMGDIDTLEAATARITQFDRLLTLHGSPKLRIPQQDASGTTQLQTDVLVDPDKQYDYLQATGAFDALMRATDKFLAYTLARGQMSPGLLGLRFDGASHPDTAEKLRIEATNTLARGQQTAGHMEPAIGLALEMATAIEARLPGRGWPVGPVRAEMRPQLPKDSVTLARELDEMLSAPKPLIDHRTALRMLHGEERGDAIFGAIQEDAARAAQNQAMSLGAEIGMGSAGEGSA